MRRGRRRYRFVEEPVNHDRWLVSYADLITTLFAFFVVLFASSYRDSQTIKKLSQAIHVGFQELGGFAGGEKDHGVAYPNLPLSTDIPQVGTLKVDPSATTSVDLELLRRQLDSALGQEIQKHEVDTRLTPDGLVISLKELGFFSSGQAKLLPGAAGKIHRIAKVLSMRGLSLRVEGHSDNQPIHTPDFRNNWELSNARAMAVMQMLVDSAGFDPSKVSVAGYGQYRPVADNATPEGRGMNRRVDLVVIAPMAVGAKGQ